MELSQLLSFFVTAVFVMERSADHNALVIGIVVIEVFIFVAPPKPFHVDAVLDKNGVVKESGTLFVVVILWGKSFSISGGNSQ